MITVKNVSFSYDGKHNVLQDFSLSFKEGGIYGLLGKNGTGKSTLLYLMSGLLHPTKGEVLYNGMQTKLRLPEVQQDFFIVPEEYDLPSLPLQEYIDTLKPFYPNFSEETLERCLEGFQMKKTMNLGALSMGQKKKVYMCIALAANTKVLLMDEPTNGLDILSKSQFRKVVVTGMNEDKIIIISTHQVHDVEHILDHVTIIDENRVLHNAPLHEEEEAIDLEKLFIEKNLNPVPVEIEIEEQEQTTINFTKKSTWESLKSMARWDLTLNRSFYIKCFAVVFVLLFLPFITYLTNEIANLIHNYKVSMHYAPLHVMDISSFFLLLPILIGFTFHNLRNRQSRLGEFTLPVANRVKFLWHTCFTILGSFVAVVLSAVALDIIQMLLVGLTSGWENTQCMTLKNIKDIPEAVMFVIEFTEVQKALAIVTFGYTAFASTFLLGNALKYKSNIMLTIGFHFALCCSMLMLTVLSLYNLHDRWWFGRFFYEDAPGVLISCIIFACIIAFCWWKSYRLYCGGQITSKRNK